MIWFFILLGIVQGITEFLPISSSGHLALGRMIFSTFELPGLLFEILVHVATAIVIIIFLRKEILALILSLFRWNRSISPSSTGSGNPDINNHKLLLLIIISSIPTAIIGYLIKDFAEASFNRPLIIEAGYFITFSLLLLSILAKDGGKSIYHISYFDALIIGVIQGIAVMPGISRSGSTIVIALLLGIVAESAVRFSFLISLPAITGALLLDLYSLTKYSGEISINIPFVISGMIAAGITGYIALRILFNLTKKMKLHYFAPYCILIIILILLFK